MCKQKLEFQKSRDSNFCLFVVKIKKVQVAAQEHYWHAEPD